MSEALAYCNGLSESIYVLRLSSGIGGGVVQRFPETVDATAIAISGLRGNLDSGYGYLIRERGRLSGLRWNLDSGYGYLIN